MLYSLENSDLHNWQLVAWYPVSTIFLGAFFNLLKKFIPEIALLRLMFGSAIVEKNQ